MANDPKKGTDQEGFPEAAKKDWKEHFPQAADQHRTQGTRSPDEERAAVRTQNKALEHQEKQAQQAAREAEPVPTGEGENPHEGEENLDKDSPAQPKKP